ncbi:MAG: hypothetical protein R3E84_09590 [Pseudomonadales bacterium]
MNTGQVGRSTRLLMVIALALIAYWLTFSLLVTNSSDGMDWFHGDFSVVTRELGSPVIPGNATWEPASDLYTWRTCAQPCYFAVRMPVPTTPPGDDLAIAPSYNTDSFALFLNGYRLEVKGVLAPVPGLKGKRTWLTRLPAALLRGDGTDMVDLVLARRAKPASFRGAFIGPHDVLAEALERRFFTYYEWPRITAIGGLTLGGLVLLLLPLVRQRALLAWFAVAALSWALLSLYRLWFDFPWSESWRAAYYFALLNLVYLALFNFFDLWSGQNRRTHRLVATLAYFVSLGLYATLVPTLAPERLEAWLGDTYQVAICIGLLVKAVRHYFVDSDTTIVESSAVFLVISAAIFDVVAQVLGIFYFYSLTRSFPLFVVAIVACLFHRNIRLYESEQAINEMLNTELAAKESALAASFEREAERTRALLLANERQRLLRDMHDGVGGRLAALIQAMRQRPDADPALTDALQLSLQELRLVMDSLDPDLADDFGSALGVLRGRLQSLLDTHGVALNWEIDLPDRCALGVERTLQVYRCIQEAVSNALRHARASSITLYAHADGGSLTVRIVDDGVGGLAAKGGGRGLGIMRKRLAAMGGSLHTDSSQTGSSVTLSIPIVAGGCDN